ncbi:MAG TPA: ATP-binding protein [Bryobacteraceae bacterium]|nr:ATP-binding protein [Bryobacteraceae bacterium]
MPRLGVFNIAAFWVAAAIYPLSAAPTKTLLSARVSAPRVYTSTKDVLGLSRVEAAAGFEVELKGIVTLRIPQEKRIFVQDASGGIFIRTGSLPEVHTGDFVLVRGRTDSGKFAPVIAKGAIARIRAASLPAPRRLALDDLRFPDFECEFVESEGTVRSIYQSKKYWLINLSKGSFRISALVYAPSGDGRPYPGDVIRIRGVASTIFNNKAQYLGTRLLLQDFSQTEVIRTGARDDANLPLTSIGKLLTYNSHPSSQERIRVSGAVTCNGPDGIVCIQNGPDGVEVNTGVRQDLQIGEFIEVIGFPAFNSYSPTLEDVSIRRLDKIGHVKPLPISSVEAQSGQYDGRLVEMTGTIMVQEFRSRWKDRPDLYLTLRNGPHVFTARLPRQTPDPVRHLRTGSRVQLIGVCHVNTKSLAASDNPFTLRMRTVSDLNVLEATSWWTLERAMLAVAALGMAVAFGIFWLTLLRRKVHRQTSIIRSQLQLETALSERFRDLFEHSTDLVFTVDLNGQFLAMNLATKQTLGCTGVDTRGLSLHSFARQEDLPILTDIFGILIGGQPSVLRQLSVRSSSGQNLVLEMNCRLRHAHGVPTSIDIIARDVTEQKREQIAREEARIAAEAASRAKSEFLANMSHEIRTPMSGILGMTELTLATDLTDEQRNNLEVVKTSAESLLTVINDILDFSKIEAGRMELEHAPFNISRVVEGCLDLVSVPAAEKSLELICDIDPTLPYAWIGDAARLRQVLLNLTGNAVKFTEAGEVILRVEHVQLEDGTSKARFSVRDTGIGIEVEQHKRIFEMFCQADGSTSRQYGGTGLGLAIASRLVALMGSRLTIESAPGKGSTFGFVLDVASRTEAPLIQPASLQGQMACLFEPNDSSRTAIERVLTHAGVTIVNDDRASVVIATEDQRRLDSPLVLLLGVGQSVPKAHRAAAVIRKPVAPCSLIKAIEGTTHLQTVLALDAIGRGSAEPNKAWKNLSPQKTVLLAEDNKVNQMLALRTLEKGGYKVLVANNGIEAVQAAKHTEVDLILMDIQMPEMDGFQAAARIRDARRANGQEPLPVIAMTAHALKGDRERCIAAGLTDYISKPVRPVDLMEIVSRYVGASVAEIV